MIETEAETVIEIVIENIEIKIKTETETMIGIDKETFQETGTDTHHQIWLADTRQADIPQVIVKRLIMSTEKEVTMTRREKVAETLMGGERETGAKTVIPETDGEEKAVVVEMVTERDEAVVIAEVMITGTEIEIEKGGQSLNQEDKMESHQDLVVSVCRNTSSSTWLSV